MQTQNKPQHHLVAGMVVSMFLWGLSWPSAKVLTHYCSVVNFTVYRYCIVVLTMAVLLPTIKIQFRISKKGIPFFVASGGLLALYSLLLFEGLKNGTAGAGGVLVTIMNPIMAYVIGFFIDKRLPKVKEIIGLALGVAAGAVLLKIGPKSTVLTDGGNLYFLGAAFLWAAMSKITSHGATYGSSMSFSFWQYLVTFLCLLPFADYHEMGTIFTIHDPLFWGNLFFGSAIVTALATTVYFYTTTQLGAEKASSFIFMVPFAAAISSWLLLGEVIHLNTAIGGALGILAVYIMLHKKGGAKAAAAAAKE